MRHGWRGVGREGGEVGGGGEQVHLRAKFVCEMLSVGGLVWNNQCCSESLFRDGVERNVNVL